MTVYPCTSRSGSPLTTVKIVRYLGFASGSSDLKRYLAWPHVRRGPVAVASGECFARHHSLKFSAPSAAALLHRVARPSARVC